MQLCLDDHEEKINQLANECSVLFDVQVEKQLNLLTIRHYDDPIISQLYTGKEMLLEQKQKILCSVFISKTHLYIFFNNSIQFVLFKRLY